MLNVKPGVYLCIAPAAACSTERQLDAVGRGGGQWGGRRGEALGGGKRSKANGWNGFADDLQGGRCERGMGVVVEGGGHNMEGGHNMYPMQHPKTAMLMFTPLTLYRGSRQTVIMPKEQGCRPHGWQCDAVFESQNKWQYCAQCLF